MHRFVLEIITDVYDNVSPALMGWSAFLATLHAIVVIIFVLCWLTVENKTLSLSTVELSAVNNTHRDMTRYAAITLTETK